LAQVADDDVLVIKRPVAAKAVTVISPGFPDHPK